MRNFKKNKNAERITKAVEAFISKNFSPLQEEAKIRKIGEFLKGFKEIKKVNDTAFVILRFPEGIEMAIDLNGNLFDLDEIDYNKFNFIEEVKR